MNEKLMNEMIEKYVDSKFFDTDALKQYLRTHDKVEGYVFLTRKKVQLIEAGQTFNNPYSGWFFDSSNRFQIVDRDTFIRRIPFYFYYPKNVGNKITKYGSIKDLLLEYQTFERENHEFIPVADNEDGFYVIDEPFYEILEDLFYNYHISLEDIFEYVHRQCNKCVFWVFYTWYKYVKLAHKLGITDLTPINVLWAYNVALEKDGQKPIVYEPKYCVGFNELYERHNGYILMGGYFPVNPDNGEINKKWIRIWIEGEHYITPESYLSADAKDRPFTNPLEVNIRIGLTRSTIICVADDQIEGMVPREVALNRDLHVWEPIYIGIAAMQFDMDAIRFRRKEIGYTQSDVAAILDISARTYQNWEMRVSDPDALNLIRLLNLLNINNVQEIIRKAQVIDDKFEKFLSGKPYSSFIETSKKGGA